MTGFYLFCTFKIWIIPLGQQREIPYTTTQICKVLIDENYAVETLAPQQYFIDCREDLKWLETSTSLEMWVEKDQCSIERREKSK